MFLKKNLSKLGLILLLTSLYPSIGQAYIYDYKGGTRNNVIVGGKGNKAVPSPYEMSKKYKYGHMFGTVGYLYAGVETQFTQYFSLISTLGVDIGSFWALDLNIIPRLYLGIPYLFVGLGTGVSLGSVMTLGSDHYKGDYHPEFTTVNPFLNLIAEAGVSIPFSQSFSMEILAIAEMQIGFNALIASTPIGAKINLNFKV